MTTAYSVFTVTSLSWMQTRSRCELRTFFRAMFHLHTRFGVGRAGQFESKRKGSAIRPLDVARVYGSMEAVNTTEKLAKDNRGNSGRRGQANGHVVPEGNARRRVRRRESSILSPFDSQRWRTCRGRPMAAAIRRRCMAILIGIAEGEPYWTVMRRSGITLPQWGGLRCQYAKLQADYINALAMQREYATQMHRAAARKRAVDGWLVPIMYNGKQVASRRYFSDRLLIRLVEADRRDEATKSASWEHANVSSASVSKSGTDSQAIDPSKAAL